MPANLPAEAKAKWARYLDAKTPEEKLRALQEFYSSIPKHKGTENLRAWVRRKIAELKEEIAEQKARRRGGGVSFFVQKEGAAQVVMLGETLSGKSTLLRALTNAEPEIRGVPFTTLKPVPGMVRYEDIQFQLVEVPAVVEGMHRGAVWWGSRVLGMARNADLLMIVIDLSNNPVKQLKTIIEELREAGIMLRRPKGRVVIERSKAVHGIRVIALGRLVDATAADVIKLLNSYRIYHAIVKIYGDATLDDVEKAIFERTSFKRALFVLNKVDLVSAPRAEALARKIVEALPDSDAVVVSALKGYRISEIPQRIFRLSGVIRVYTKEPNQQKPSEIPLILKKGATVADAIMKIREEFLQYFKYARIWGPSAKFPGERVGLDHVLEDGDIIEIRTTIKGI